MIKLRKRSLVQRLKAWASYILPVVCFHPSLPSLSVGESKKSPFASRVVVQASLLCSFCKKWYDLFELCIAISLD